MNKTEIKEYCRKLFRVYDSKVANGTICNNVYMDDCKFYYRNNLGTPYCDALKHGNCDNCKFYKERN